MSPSVTAFLMDDHEVVRQGVRALLESTGPAGDHTPLHVHHLDDEGFYVLEGSVTIHVGEQTVELAAGQLSPAGDAELPEHRAQGGSRPCWR